MKISTKGRYGLRALVDLASNTQNSAVSLVNVAGRQRISLNYLEQVFGLLRKAEIVKSTKGSQGGYMLACNAEDLKVGTILRALEGKFSIVDETDDDVPKDRIQWAIQELVWDEINCSIQTFLDKITLADLVERYQILSSMKKIR